MKTFNINLESIFLNNKIQEEIDQTHQKLSSNFNNALNHLKNQDISFETYVLAYMIMNKNNKENILNEEKNIREKLNDVEFSWKNLNVFDLPQCQQMIKFTIFNKMLKENQTDPNKLNKKHHIQNLSLCSISSCIVYLFKLIWLSNHFDQENYFYGSYALTNPVKKFFKNFLGITSPQQYETQIATQNIALKCNCDPLRINTGMFLISQKQ